MAFLVQLTDDATRDLEEICDYIDRHDEPDRTDYVLEQIEKAFSSLSEYPERGKLSGGTAGHWDSGIPRDILQALPHRLSGDEK